MEPKAIKRLKKGLKDVCLTHEEATWWEGYVEALEMMESLTSTEADHYRLEIQLAYSKGT